MGAIVDIHSTTDRPLQDLLFSRIADDLENKGFSIQPTALPIALTDELSAHLQSMRPELFDPAGIGRSDDYAQNQFIRSDQICWINGNSQAGRHWLDWTTELQTYLNRRLFLGLFSFESHFAHYRAGDFYRRHYDAFRGQANRILSVVVYLNPQWHSEDGGELILYQSDEDQIGIKITPLYGTIVVFLSEEFPHEVLAAGRDRYSIAGWFRINTTSADYLDPPT